jgi:peptidoglycan hydrolase CwlO-like protein
MDWAILATIIAALGGREVFSWLANRKAYARKENAIATDAELTVHEKQIERYEQRLSQRDAKVDAIYRELREEQKRNLDLIEKINRLELDKELITLQKCEMRGCRKRQPPSSVY